MKKYITLLIVLSILPIAAQVDFGMRLRLRSEMQTLNATNSDNQVYDRAADIRMRPNIDYTVNDYISLRAVLEIGNIRYGSNGGTIGTDGVNLQTKNLFMSLQPTRNHIIKLGLLPYKDAHSMIVDTDMAGIMWHGRFEDYSVNLGWFAALDEGEKYLGEKSHSFGSTVFLADFSYRMNDMFTFGVNNFFVISKDDFSDQSPREEVRIFFAPRVQAEIGPFSADAQFVANNNYAVYNPYNPHNGFSQPKDSDRTGLALSLKTRFQMDERTTFRANLLFRGCYENWENYEDFMSDYDTGLEIINENPFGISSHNPMKDFVVHSPNYNPENPRGHIYQLGVVVPALFVDWKYMDNVTFTGGFGFIMNDQAYGKSIDWSDPSSLKTNDLFMAWELDLKAKVTMYDDQISFLPYMAFFMPSDNFAMNITENADNFTSDMLPAADMQFKIGMTVNYNF